MFTNIISNGVKHVSRIEYVLAGVGVVLGIGMAWHVSQLGLTLALTDQNAHLNFSRLVTDSMTPGISQLGFWPPLLHLLMMPIVGIYESLYRSGLAGFVVLLPFFVMGSVFLYRTILLLTRQRLFAFTGGLLFLFNPYVLYYTVTPMMEVLFLANLTGVAYFLALWMQKQKVSFLIAAALFVSLASLSRYEGFILVPLGALLVFIFLRHTHKPFKEIEASIILFLSLASWGMFAVFLYSWVFGGTPFAFTGGWWIRDPENFYTKHNILLSLQYLGTASFYMIGKPLVLFSFASGAALLVMARKHVTRVAPLLVLFSPFVMIVFTLFRGSPPLMAPELPPFGLFFNERYALTWVGFAIAAPLVLMRVVSASRANVVPVGCLSLLAFAGVHFYEKVLVEEFREIQQNLGTDDKEVRELNEYFAEEYDYGKIFITRTINDSLITHADIPLKNFIYEANYLFYTQAMEEPWFFTRWVFMYNPEGKDQWARAREPISRRWGSSDIFATYYEVVFETSSRKIYKIKEVEVEKLARERGYDIAEIPSVNPSLISWDPQEVYEKIKQAKRFDGRVITSSDNSF